MDLLTGFATILVVIAAGAGLAHAGVLDRRSQRTLGEIAFFVASPTLLLVTISRVHLESAAINLVASSVSLGVVFATYAVVARLRWRLSTGPLLIGALSSSYVNAGNLGIAIAAYVVGDITVVVPALLVQMLLVQPPSLVVLDRITGRGNGVRAVARRLVTNPLTVAAVVGVVLAATGWTLPQVVLDPLELLGGAAIPLLLMSYGAALRLSPPLGRAGHNGEVLLASVLKLLVMPAVAWAVAAGLGLDGRALLGVVITAALPTAQNIFLHATRYRVGEDVSRETILVTTVASLPVVLLIALVLG
ncbi:AEC family transporter [Nocardioides sp. zg-1228]|uniref:AEC family transporter n=1 Tax=Nocardioides sp. zg-1228 TaxID=2763008 RepID=UPI001642EAD0|nr:AEC family transporter [Nocardioides sp. zg-1228]MBC2931778.1 AEC family transporter [Nocardioides sp. zg-1228]QSF57357.1 AEC family transporter [Nocardioides sp. zg-1228]